MIYSGSQGCLCFYDKNEKLCCSLALTKNKTREYYEANAYQIIKEGLMDNTSLDDIKLTLLKSLHLIGGLKKYKRTKQDEKMLGLAFLGLIKLKCLDFDDVCLQCPRKKNKR